MTRTPWAAVLAGTFFSAAIAGIPLEPPEVEEGAAFARAAAASALASEGAAFAESLDADGILVGHLGESAWRALTDRQKGELRAYVRDRFLRTLAAPRNAAAGIAWSSATPAGVNGLHADIGLKLGDKTLKTRWAVSRRGGAWKVADVRLSDPGISLAQAAARSLGAVPVRRRDRAQRVRLEMLPRLLGLLAILVVVIAARRRLSGPRRALLYWTAAAPAVLFLVDGALAARRASSETYALVDQLPGEPWKQAEELADRAQRQGNLAKAQQEWSRALAQGAPAGPVLYRMAQLARERGLTTEAQKLFERSVAEKNGAPGALRELAAGALEQRRDGDARDLLQRYVAVAGPDPETLWLLAVAESNLGDHAASIETMRAARAMLGDSAEGAELEARVRARAADAPGAVEALRRLEPSGRLDRSALRADPDYLPIATEPAWVTFLAETPRAVPVTPTPATGAGNR